MRCKNIQVKLVDYYENSLPPEEKKLVQSHLEICSSCQEELQKIRSTFELLKNESAYEPDEAYWINFIPGVRSKIEKGWGTTLVPIPKLKIIGGIVSLALVLLLGIFFFKEDQRVMFKSSEEPYSYLLPAEGEKIDQLFYAEAGNESSISKLFSDTDRNKLALAEIELEKNNWGKGGKEEALRELDLKQLENLKKDLEKTKFKKEIL
ncbi:MAG: zf-HC2 domain-containing protein [candidate division Zixibacteria bacterium]|nr:zf-HC2 domain-containing protein [candidate division Zixibacteria bacterium]